MFEAVRRKNFFYKDRSSQTLLPPPTSTDPDDRALTADQEASFDLVKINRHGSRQSRTLVLSPNGIKNTKGKSCKWYFPTGDVFSIEKDKASPSRCTIGVIRYYDFQCASPGECDRVIEKFEEYFTNYKKVSPNNINNNNSNNNKFLSSSQQATTSTTTAPWSGTGSKHSFSLETANSKNSDQNKRVSVDDFEIVKRLGKGSFSNVFLVRKKDTKQMLAMKGKSCRVCVFLKLLFVCLFVCGERESFLFAFRLEKAFVQELFFLCCGHAHFNCCTLRVAFRRHDLFGQRVAYEFPFLLRLFFPIMSNGPFMHFG